MRRIALIAVAALVVAAGIVVAHRGHANPQVTTPAVTEPLASGTLILSLKGTGAASTLTVPAQDMAPGAAEERAVALDNVGTVPIQTISMTVTPSTSASSALNTLTPQDISMSVFACGGQWQAQQLSDGGYSYSCQGGSTTTIVSSTPVAQMAQPVTIETAPLLPGQSDVLVVRTALASSLTNAAQGQSVTLVYKFEAVQSPGGAA